MEWLDFDELDFADNGFALHSGVWFPSVPMRSHGVYRFIDKLSPEREPVKTESMSNRRPARIMPESSRRPRRVRADPARPRYGAEKLCTAPLAFVLVSRWARHCR